MKRSVLQVVTEVFAAGAAVWAFWLIVTEAMR